MAARCRYSREVGYRLYPASISVARLPALRYVYTVTHMASIDCFGSLLKSFLDASPGEIDGDGALRKRPLFAENDCLEIATYYFQTLLNILRYATNSMLAQLATELVINGDEGRAKTFAQCGCLFIRVVETGLTEGRRVSRRRHDVTGILCQGRPESPPWRRRRSSNCRASVETSQDGPRYH